MAKSQASLDHVLVYFAILYFGGRNI